jgi:hypothetical protein
MVDAVIKTVGRLASGGASQHALLAQLSKANMQQFLDSTDNILCA